MEIMMEKSKINNSANDDKENTLAFKPLINLRRKQTRKIVVQIDEEMAQLADEYVRFATESFGYQVTSSEVLNEILRGHFTRDSGFKGWRVSRSENKS